ncbi:MAG: DUF2206 domain-containing protein [Thermoleophilia bacterium]|nr:DUF2206 domain-containing protein [Thermoleophilia bacterium]
MSTFSPKPPRGIRDSEKDILLSPADGSPALEMTATRQRVQLYFLLIVSLFVITIFVGLKYASAFLYPSMVFGLLVSLALPGFMLIRLLRVECRFLTDSVLYSIGASIFLLLSGGLLINALLPWLGIKEPLGTLPIVVLLVFMNVALMAACSLSGADLTVHIRFPKISSWVMLLYVVPPLFVVVGVMGSVGLNNGATNLPVMIVLGAIGAYSILLLFFRERIPGSVFPYALYFMTLAVLLGISLRGWVISGHDILYEFAVFQMTKDFSHWSMDYYRDAYNACLSITLLPAMLSRIMPKVPDQLVFRVIFQMIFALTPVALFRFLRKYLNNAAAFLACLFFVSQPALLQDFAFLTRQEMALFFDVLVLLAFSSKSSTRFQQYFLGVIFGITMIWSHYSTTYIAIAILLFVLFVRNRFAEKLLVGAKRILASIAAPVLSRTPKVRVDALASEQLGNPGVNAIHSESRSRWLPGWIFVLSLLALTMVWNMWITGTQNNFTTFLGSVYQNVSGPNGFSEYKTGLTDQLRIYNVSATQADVMESFVSSHTGGLNTTEMSRYTADTYKDYNARIDANVMFNPASGEADSLYSYWEIFKKFAKAFIIIGAAWLVISSMASLFIDDDLRILIAMNMFVLALAMLVPFFSTDYSLMRAFQQLLIVLSLPAVFGAFAVFGTIARRYAIYLTSIFFVVYFLLLSSFLPQLIGFGYAQMHLNNWGVYYDIHYSHQSEYDAINWLADNGDPQLPVFADFYSKKKMEVFSPRKLWVVDNVLPQNINRGAYVYVNYTNKKKELAYTPFKGNEFSYRFPREFLDQQKDIIYTNGETEIMK